MTPALAAAVIGAGAIGAVLRYLTTLLFPHDAATGRLPLGVLAVNAIGSFLAGLLLGLATQSHLSSEWSLILITGLCGGLTTFSTFSVEAIQLVERGRWRTAAASIGANLVLGIGLAAIGFILA
ncbi:fluoride efflux transporter CrcB [Mycetocola zhadangensis]|uniref:Fluoride-specific ion channel FluC n=1 Tax=Mycetocola zhadangensis TaxID=1164595 RepID=A0A3L7J7P1_9MICO|nr:fluoride efflux transporter CrcB [Mycetocola zhadangensis]RLQ84522.1 fluoride efflux transporter CrcB [Mycetocola zhadangensis]GGE92248.1 putative fluoride ion transporter CrcB 1 [Mycetocola zhadangensis]